MYQIKMVIHPEGNTDVILQSSKNEESSNRPIAFYLRLEREINKFRKNIQKIIISKGLPPREK